MDAHGYLEEVVRPILKELEGRQNDRAFIMSAAIVTFHLADWIAMQKGDTLNNVRNRVSEKFENFKYLKAVANAHKHGRIDKEREFLGLTDPLTPQKEPESIVARSGQKIKSRSDEMICTRAQAPMYKFDDGTLLVPLDLLKTAVEAMHTELIDSNHRNENLD